MKLLFLFILGCIMNRVRGGGHGVWRKKYGKLIGVTYDADGKAFFLTKVHYLVYQLADGKILNALVFALVLPAVLALEYIGQHSSGVPEYVFAGYDWELAGLAFIAMLVGSAPGWGDYIGALGGWRKSDLMEWEPIDQLIEKFEDRPKLWGYVGMTLRCFIWGMLLGLTFNTFGPFIAGALGGSIAWLALKIKGQDGGWPLFEWMLGGPLWASCLIL